MGKILEISLKQYFTPNTSGCYRLKNDVVEPFVKSRVQSRAKMTSTTAPEVLMCGSTASRLHCVTPTSKSALTQYEYLNRVSSSQRS